MVDTLNDKWQAGEMMMPLGTGLSINYPAAAPEEIQGVKIIENEEVYTDFQNYAFDEEKGGIYNHMDFEKYMEIMKDPEIETDLTEANRGFVIVSVIDGNWNAEAEKVAYMEDAIGSVPAK